jgi:hypothetical protein
MRTPFAVMLILTARKTSPFRVGMQSADSELSLTRRLLLFNVLANYRAPCRSPSTSLVKASRLYFVTRTKCTCI